MNRNTDSARLLLYSTADSLTNPPSSISRELIALGRVELISSFHKTDITFLNQVHESHTSVADIFTSNRNNKAKVVLNQLILCGLIALHNAFADFCFLLSRKKRNSSDFTHIQLHAISNGSFALVPRHSCSVFSFINDYIDASFFQCGVDSIKLFFLENLFNFRFVDNSVVFNCFRNQSIKSFFHRYPLLFPFIKYHFFSYIYIITYFL